jgi:hypothetical protein
VPPGAGSGSLAVTLPCWRSADAIAVIDLVRGTGIDLIIRPDKGAKNRYWPEIVLITEKLWYLPTSVATQDTRHAVNVFREYGLIQFYVAQLQV